MCPARPVTSVAASPYCVVLAWSDATDCTYVSEMRAVDVGERVPTMCLMSADEGALGAYESVYVRKLHMMDEHRVTVSRGEVKVTVADGNVYPSADVARCLCATLM